LIDYGVFGQALYMKTPNEFYNFKLAA
jgi:hypothetical protein